MSTWGKLVICKTSKWRKLSKIIIPFRKKQKDRQERTPHQNRQISLILGRTFSYFERVWNQAMSFRWGHPTVTVPDFSPDEVVVACAWTWSSFPCSDSTSPINWHFSPQTICRWYKEGIEVLVCQKTFCEPLLVRSRKYQHPILQDGVNSLQEKSWEQSAMFFKNCCITDTLGSSKNETPRQASKQ